MHLEGTRTLVLERPRPRITIKHAACLHDDPATLLDVMVTARGQLEFAPLLAVIMRHVPPGAHVVPRRHEAIEIVTLMLAGSLVWESSHGARCTLGREDVFLCSAGSGLAHAAYAVSDEPVCALELWLQAPANVAPRVDHRTMERTGRIGQLAKIAGRGAPLATHADVAIRSAVLPAGSSVVHRSSRRSYLVSTVGRISIDGQIAEPGARVRMRGPGSARITALESTEVVALGV